MKRKMIAVLMILILAVSLAACGSGEETTLTGMVVSVDGTVISLVEMDGEGTGMNSGSGEMPQMPEDMEGFEGFSGFGGFDPESFGGEMPEGGSYPQWGEGEMPQMPDGMELPEDMTMPGFGGMGGMNFGNMAEDMETKSVDIGDAHISVEIDGGKASGSMDDIQAGVFVTITANGKGKVTNVLVSSQSSFGGMGGMNWGG